MATPAQEQFLKNDVTRLIKLHFLKTVLICPPILFQIFNNLKLNSLKTYVVCTSQAAFSRNIAINYANYSFYLDFAIFSFVCLFHFEIAVKHTCQCNKLTLHS